MSLRWIHENLKAPTCNEECSDIDDSCSDESYDTDVLIQDDQEIKQKAIKRTVARTFVENSEACVGTQKVSPYVIWDPRSPAENPVYKSLVIKLFCRTCHHLAIAQSGRVLGLHENNNVQTLFRVTSLSFGVIRIQNVKTELFLAFDKKGHLYGEEDANKENTEWEQWSIGSYDAFRSRKYSQEGWWIGIKKNGRAKSGCETSWGQKSIQFVAITQR